MGTQYSLTRQQMFDKSAIGMLTQMRQSRAGTDIETMEVDQCLYRGPNGLKCAIGFLIPDAIYKPAMEVGLDELLMTFPEIAPYIPDIQLASALMGIHDRTDPESWGTRLMTLGALAGLETIDLHAFIHEIKYIAASATPIAAHKEADTFNYAGVPVGYWWKKIASKAAKEKLAA